VSTWPLGLRRTAATGGHRGLSNGPRLAHVRSMLAVVETTFAFLLLIAVVLRPLAMKES
jgi:hypothetical protein